MYSPITYFQQKYLLKKLPYWYHKFVNQEEIPVNILQEIKQNIKKNSLDKKGVKKLLLEIQKKNAAKNKELWNTYLEKTLPNKYQNLTLEIKQNAELTAVIVEARKHPHFKVVVENIIANTQHLGVTLNIYHGTDNEHFIKEALKKHNNINFINLNVPNLDIEAYNKIMLSKDFWAKINSEKILVFQTDTITFKPLKKEFLEFDYIGAPWKKHISKKNKVAVGNGGLSLRSKKMMLDIISQNVPRKKNMPEDVYLCQIIKHQNYKLANFSTAIEFATENVFNQHAFGCHKIWEETSAAQLKLILKPPTENTNH